MAERTQRSNILLAFISLTAVIAVVSLIGFFTLGKGPEIIQGQAEADEYRVSGKVPARILELRVKEGDKVNAGDKLLSFDPEKIKEHGYEKTCILVVTNGDDYPDMKLHTGMDAVQGETVIAEF